MRYQRKRKIVRRSANNSKQVSRRTSGIGQYIQKIKNIPKSLKVNPLGLGMANYCGPGTKLEGQRSMSKTDDICKKHDYDYENIKQKMKSGDYSRDESIKKTRQADNEMLTRLKKTKENNWVDKIVHTAGTLGIKAKTILEDLNILDPLRFSTSN